MYPWLGLCIVYDIEVVAWLVLLERHESKVAATRQRDKSLDGYVHTCLRARAIDWERGQAREKCGMAQSSAAVVPVR